MHIGCESKYVTVDLALPRTDDCRVAFEPAELSQPLYRGIRRVGTGVGLALVDGWPSVSGSAEAGLAAEGGARFTILIARNLDCVAPK